MVVVYRVGGNKAFRYCVIRFNNVVGSVVLVFMNDERKAMNGRYNPSMS
ncbi:hypothetical protein [Caldivirga maquilingensis]|nr:hypothetical protein [Caldivirga maquilingensis]